MKKKSTLAMLILLVLAVLISGCSSTSSGPIRIGLVGTLQGATADLAINGKRGAEIAVSDINRNGGINGRLVELDIRDSLNDKKVAQDILQSFVNDGVKLVIGDFVSSLTQGILDSLNDNDMLYISPTAASEPLVGLDDHLIRMNMAADGQVHSLIRLTEINNDKQILVFKDSNNASFSNSIGDGFKKQIESVGGSVIAEIEYNGGLTIASDTVVEAIDNYGGQVSGVLLISDAVNAALITKAIRGAGSEVNIYLSRWGNTPDFYSMAGDDSEGIYTLNVFDDESDSVAYTNFIAEFLESYGSEPGFSAGLAYEAVMILAEAIEETKGTQPSKIKNYIIETGEFQGLQETLKIDQYGDCAREDVLCIVHNGKAIKVQ